MKMRTIDHRRVWALWDEGCAKRKIARDLDCDPKSVRRILAHGREVEGGAVNAHDRLVTLPDAPPGIDPEAARKLDYIRGELARGDRGRRDTALLTHSYLDVIRRTQPVRSST